MVAKDIWKRNWGGGNMEWKEVRLGDVCNLIAGFAFKAKDFGEFPTKVIKIGDIKPPFVDYVGQVGVDISCYDINKLSKYTVRYGDYVLAMTGATIGKVGKYISEHPSYINQRVLKFAPKLDVDADYINYTICSNIFAKYVVNYIDSESAQPNISAPTISKFVFRIPKEKDDQRRIASILSSLDRKIELNNKINADLEEMAQAIFKNWFVDFEPFKDGKFMDSELGMIPEGWKVGRLGELCDFKRGKNLLTKNAIDEGVPVVAGGLEPSCYHNVANTGAPVITVSGSGANAGFMRMYHVPVWASDCSFIDISCENFYFVYCFLKVNSKLLKHAQTGAVQPHVKPSDIHDFELVIPDKESIFDFQDKVKPFFDKIASIQKENSRLSLLRDTLLPRLMSGELEVPE